MKELQKLMNQVIRKVYDRDLKAGEIDPASWEQTTAILREGLEMGYGAKITAIDYTSPDYQTLQELRHNAQVFALFKNHQMVNDMVALLLDEDGKIRSFSKFRDQAQALSKIYNENWLRAEYDTAVAVGQMSARWKEYERDADLFPYIEYQTAGDDRVRPEHDVLDGVTRRIDDAFWDTYFPPNGWRCRCTTIQTAGPERTGNVLEIPEAFRNNPGKSGKMFADSHPYFDIDPDHEEAARKMFDAPVPPDPTFRAAKSLKEAEEFAIRNGLAETVDYSGVILDVANEWNQGIYNTLKRFPKLKGQIRFIGTIQARNKRIKALGYRTRAVQKNVIAESMFVPDGSKDQVLIPLNGITINSRHTSAKGYKAMIKAKTFSVQTKFRPVGANSLKATVDHELAHQLDELMKLSSNKEIKKIYDSLSFAEIHNGVGRYATTMIEEFIAECWCEFTNNPNPRPLSKQVSEIIIKEYNNLD